MSFLRVGLGSCLVLEDKVAQTFLGPMPFSVDLYAFYSLDLYFFEDLMNHQEMFFGPFALFSC